MPSKKIKPTQWPNPITIAINQERERIHKIVLDAFKTVKTIDYDSAEETYQLIKKQIYKKP